MTHYAYDALNRFTLTTYPDNTTASKTYDFRGNVLTETDQAGHVTKHVYDLAGREVSVTRAFGTSDASTTSYEYDDAGRKVTSSHANGVSVSYTYDDLNRLETVTDALLGGGQTTYSYDSASNVGTVKYPNGVQSTFSYDALNRVTGLSSATASYTYQRGYTGNLTSASESSGRAIAWSYDGINRLTSEAITGGTVNGSVSYSLDPVGNRSSASSSLTGVSSGSWNFNADDELTSESYDANGNVIATGGNTFAYNSQNQLVSMNGGTVQIVYDGDGNRVAKSANGAVTRYLVDDLNPTGYAQVVEEQSSGVVQRQYTYGLQRISQQQAISNTWTASFYGYDGGGSVRQLTNAGASVTDSYAYDAFGNAVSTSGSTPNEFLYRGEQYDSDLGLYYLRARFMNPLTGRFVSRDPEEGEYSDPVTLHKYLYADADPVNLSDPAGRSAFFELSLGDTIALGATAGLTALGLELRCAYNWEGTRTSATVAAGPFGAATQIGVCTWEDLSNRRRTLPLPIPFPISWPISVAGNPPPPKTCHEVHPDWPVNWVHFSTTPVIAAHIAGAINTGKPDELTYLGRGNPQRDVNRDLACPRGTFANTGMWCDEYPYASTAQGGAFASIAPVPPLEQHIQGGELKGFYSKLSAGQNFCVEVVP